MRGAASAQPGALGALFAKQDDPYAETDRKGARRWGGVLFLLQSALVLGLAPLTPPDAQFGSSGWIVLGGIVVCQVLAGWVLLRHGDRVGDDALLALNYLAVAALGVLIWLANGMDEGFLPIFTLWVVYVPAAHPPRRAALFFCFLVAAASAPLAYEGWDRTQAAGLLGRLVVWLVLSVVVYFRVSDYRQQRKGLTHRGEQALRMAVTDPLTGMANRRAFGEVLSREISRSDRTDSPLTLVLADLDGFKEINDAHGHMQGDVYLQRVAETIRGMLREQDLGFRWGGDEFAILLPDTTESAAQRACARLGGVVSAALARTADIDLTLSFGMAQYAPGMSPDDLVGAADEDLMAGKAGAGAAS